MKTSNGKSSFRTQFATMALAFGCVLSSTSLEAGLITSASFAPRIDFDSQRDPGSPSLADLDGDGRLDVAVVVYQSHLLTIRQNISSSAPNSLLLGPRIDLPAGPHP